ncbi:ribosomal RNA large subunit methyltransferase J [Candidatus Riesia pediculicola USDA]|uniref:Ribosomal RNA large subunit methyltransferase E n=2 Tax=Candidatus Riesia pediculicola TaxID=401619 RepID=D4G872_RIEPU|nr:ribosomal RNA large subunit methyltransferase J [Candidatus Riesia pediculicola USDA]ARC53774.1 hypothetical protein AOE55_01250 [Candidatus Riesia pediculicola]
MRVIDLGSYPGGWSLYSSKIVGRLGHIISCDIKPMDPIKNVHFFQGDVFDRSTITRLSDNLKFPAHVILSDMCPNITGISIIDIPKCFLLTEKVIEICKFMLIPEGSCILKMFYGKNFSNQYQKIRNIFSSVKIRKPHSSIKQSNEIYIIAKRFKCGVSKI